LPIHDAVRVVRGAQLSVGQCRGSGRPCGAGVSARTAGRSACRCAS
jgi:hypothetical protein